MEIAGRRSLQAVAILLAAGLQALPAGGQPADLDAWHVVSTRHFEIYTDATPERGAEIALSLELFRNAFARLAPALDLRSPAPTAILAFRDAASYAPYKSRRGEEASPSVLGRFLGRFEGNYITLDAGTDLVGSFTVIDHEYVHYFVRNNFPSVPRWLNEGLADYYSTFAVEDGVVHVGRPPERHLRWLERDSGFSLREVVTGDGPRSHQRGETGRFYAVSWALVHYLLSGGQDRADQIADFLLALDGGKSRGAAFAEAFKTTPEHMEEELRRYLAAHREPDDFPQAAYDVAGFGAPTAVKTRPARPQDVLCLLGNLLVFLERNEEAKRHFRLALARDPRHPEAQAGLALVYDLEKHWEEADALYRKAVPTSLDPRTHLFYGHHLLDRCRRARHDELEELASTARQTLARAIELDGDFVAAYVYFGAAYLVGDVDPEPAIVALKKIRGRMPQNRSISSALLKLYLKKKDFYLDRQRFEEAAWVLDHRIAGSVSDEETRRMHEEIERKSYLHQAQAALEDGDAEWAAELFEKAIVVTSDPETREKLKEQLRALRERFGLR